MLIFTRFKAVPPALASLLSFNLEASFSHRLRRNYSRAGEAQPLQLEDRPTLPALFFPSPTLIAFTDPRRDKPSSLAEVRNSMRRQVGQFLRKQLKVGVRKSGGRRPLWKLLPALAEETGRVCIGVEIDPAYVEVAIRRWQKQTGRDAVCAVTGETFQAALERCDAERGVPGVLDQLSETRVGNGGILACSATLR
jgi:hypothetical protein